MIKKMCITTFYAQLRFLHCYFVILQTLPTIYVVLLLLLIIFIIMVPLRIYGAPKRIYGGEKNSEIIFQIICVLLPNFSIPSKSVVFPRKTS